MGQIRGQNKSARYCKISGAFLISVLALPASALAISHGPDGFKLEKVLEEKKETNLQKLKVKETNFIQEDKKTETKLEEHQKFLTEEIKDADLKNSLEKTLDNKKEQIESSKIAVIAKALSQMNKKDLAQRAYKKAIELDTKNIQLRLDYAKTLEPGHEQSKQFLKSLDETALTSIAESWLEAGKKQAKPSFIKAAMLPYQIAILKNPKEAKLRYQFARALEKAGAAYLEEASRRYLEAAALAKIEYLQGKSEQETLMRDSIESLISTLTAQGKFVSAEKYCLSYLNLGFEKFNNGKSTKGILTRIKKHKDPFHRS